MVVKRVIRAYESYDVDAVSDATGLECKDVSKAVQSQRDEADINVIMRNFGVTGRLPDSLRPAPSYGDFTGVDDYQSALDAIRRADESFMMLDASVRARFENDPQQFFEFCTTPGHDDELRGMGLLPPLPEPGPVDPA